MKSGNIRFALAGVYALWSFLLWTGSAQAQAPFYQDMEPVEVEQGGVGWAPCH